MRSVKVEDREAATGQRSRPDPSPAPTLAWIAQVVSGALLLLLVTVHMIANHFVVKGGLRDYAQVAAYVGNPLVLAIEVAFLLVVTWHIVLGIHALLLDLGVRGRAGRVAGRVLAGLGLATVAYGLWLLLTIASKA
jgi:succinate dehydrogenase hydrophobic anchor subunit